MPRTHARVTHYEVSSIAPPSVYEPTDYLQLEDVYSTKVTTSVEQNFYMKLLQIILPTQK